MKTVYFEKNIPKILATKAAAGSAKRLLRTGINAVKYETGLPEPALPPLRIPPRKRSTRIHPIKHGSVRPMLPPLRMKTP